METGLHEFGLGRLPLMMAMLWSRNSLLACRNRTRGGRAVRKRLVLVLLLLLMLSIHTGFRFEGR